jgi:hypothetical protein
VERENYFHYMMWDYHECWILFTTFSYDFPIRLCYFVRF